MLVSGFVTCFLSHKCGQHAHDFAQQLAVALEPRRIALLTDPFETGHELFTRIHTVEFQSFVLLLCPESWASAVCQEELRTARTRSVPILTLRLAGDVPPELNDRLYGDIQGLKGSALDKALGELAAIIDMRGALYKRIQALDLKNPPELTRAVARSLAEDSDRTLVAESLDHIASFYRPETDETTRFWLALAVGKAGTCKAKDILQRFAWENHPYPREGIRQALDMLNGRCG